jgi:hypothetical protein
MIHIMLPVQYARRANDQLAGPHRRLMAAVLQTVVDDCRDGSVFRRALERGGSADVRDVRKAVAYVASTDRSWPFSFENLCDALGLSAADLRRELEVVEASA